MRPTRPPGASRAPTAARSATSTPIRLLTATKRWANGVFTPIDAGTAMTEVANRLNAIRPAVRTRCHRDLLRPRLPRGTHLVCCAYVAAGWSRLSQSVHDHDRRPGRQGGDRASISRGPHTFDTARVWRSWPARIRPCRFRGITASRRTTPWPRSRRRSSEASSSLSTPSSGWTPPCALASSRRPHGWGGLPPKDDHAQHGVGSNPGGS